MRVTETVRSQINYIIKDFRPKTDLLYLDRDQFRIVKGKSSLQAEAVAHATLELSALTYETIKNREFMSTLWQIATLRAVETFIRKIQVYVSFHLPRDYTESDPQVIHSKIPPKKTIKKKPLIK